MPAQVQPLLHHALVLAGQHLERRDIVAAERVLAPYAGPRAHPNVLAMIGAIRVFQGRFGDAAELLVVARAFAPRDPMLALNLARALAGMGRTLDAQAAFLDAIRLKPDLVEARFELGHLLHKAAKMDAAEDAFRQLLRIMPGNVHAMLALGAVRLDAGRPQDAELVLRRGLDATADPQLKAQFWLQISMALRRQRKDHEALAACESAAAIDPIHSNIAPHRAEALQNLGRHEEALEILRGLLAKSPGDAALHHSYNDLLYRLGRDEEFLKSYDRAPEARLLQLGKAFFLGHSQRDEECLSIYGKMLARDPEDGAAAIGAAKALVKLKRHREASVAYDQILARHNKDANLFSLAAEPAMLDGDPEKAVQLCQQGLALAPHNLSCLANLSTAWRMMEDERDESLNRYDSLIRVYDLEPPEGFSDMASFNAELDAALDGLHPGTREFIGQSLRGGTQTPDQLFGAGHTLVAKLRSRIDQAVERYISDLGEDNEHPLISRQKSGFRYAGSWSSRLRDSGFHVNHIHPEGWISSCYYVAVPDAVKDEAAQQGWIKFGEPFLDVKLLRPIRKAIQPIAGRLVLFPSYTWHGTNPFHDKAARTTIAFDVAPSS